MHAAVYLGNLALSTVLTQFTESYTRCSLELICFIILFLGKTHTFPTNGDWFSLPLCW